MLVNDLRREASTSLLEVGAIARGAEFLITSLPTPAVVSQVMEGPNGVLGQLAASATWIKMTTTDGDEVKRSAALAAERGVNTVELPVICSVERTISGDLTLLVGGDATHIEACREVFDAVASKVVHTGPLGSASVIKLITNLFAYVHLWAMGHGRGTDAGQEGGHRFGHDTGRHQGELRQQLRRRERGQVHPRGYLQRRFHHGLGR